VLVGPGSAWSGRVREGAETGEDLGEQVVAGWEAQGEAAGVTDQAGGDGDQPSSQGGDHGLAAADTVPEQPSVAAGGGEVVPPPAAGGGEQRTPHPGAVHRLVSGGEVARTRAVLGVAEQFLDLGVVAVQVLHLRGLRAGRHVEVGDNERVAEHAVGLGDEAHVVFADDADAIEVEIHPADGADLADAQAGAEGEADQIGEVGADGGFVGVDERKETTAFLGGEATRGSGAVPFGDSMRSSSRAGLAEIAL